ncbi:MAG: SigE family RNA polymerase sigma factor [Natronosporangium sp.]
MRVDAEQDFVEYLSARLPRLHRTAYLLCGDAHLAEDLVQSTALALYRKWRTVASADNRDAYVHRVLVNQFLGERRRHWSRVLLSDRPPEPSPRPPGDGAEERDAVRAALARLGARQRAVLVLRFFCDLTVADTAVTLRCSEGTVKSQTARGLATMRRLLAAAPDSAPELTKGGSSHA